MEEAGEEADSHDDGEVGDPENRGHQDQVRSTSHGQHALPSIPVVN